MAFLPLLLPSVHKLVLLGHCFFASLVLCAKSGSRISDELSPGHAPRPSPQRKQGTWASVLGGFLVKGGLDTRPCPVSHAVETPPKLCPSQEGVHVHFHVLENDKHPLDNPRSAIWAFGSFLHDLTGCSLSFFCANCSFGFHGYALG